jgi:hypothetical protein
VHAAARKQGNARVADEPTGSLGRVACVGVFRQESDEAAVQLLVQRREHERQRGVGDARGRRKRCGIRAQALALPQLADERMKDRTVHQERRNPPVPLMSS